MPPVTPRPAASLIVLREGPEGAEVLLGRRRGAARAFPEAVVFPGGKVEPGDAEAESRAGFGLEATAVPAGATYAALRETFEEAGVWLTEGGTAAPFPLNPGLSRLRPYAHWVTPERYPYRFDTWFFLALASETEAQAPLFGDEFEALSWRRPALALDEDRDALLPPTRHSLTRLAGFGSVSAILRDAREAPPFQATDLDAQWRAERA